MKLYKCYGFCNEKHPKENMQQISNKNYCNACYTAIKKERADREELYEYIKYAFNISFPSNYMIKQIKDFIEVRGYKLKGITLTLKYIKEILKLQLNSKFGIAIVGNYYESAKTYYIEQQKRASNHKDVKIETRTIVVKRIEPTNTYRDSLMIDMEGLL